MHPRRLRVPRLKFCGFTRDEDICAAISCGVDAVGLNFYPPSPRSIDLPTAIRFSQMLADRTLKVGVFVDEPIESVLQFAEECQLDAIQLHGNEDIPYLQRLLAAPTPATPAIWRSLAWRGNAFPEDAERCIAWQQEHPAVTFLIDAHDPIHKGGTGKKARWDLLAPKPAELAANPFLLAGGITAANAGEAIRQVGPDGIDLASGIEVSPGIKSHEMMRSVTLEVREAYEKLGNR